MSKRLRNLLIAAGVCGVLLLAVFIGVVKFTSRPEFCGTCHIMKPYVESWRRSRHSHVPCVDCHFEPGLLETFWGKFKATTHLAKYVTGTEGTKPWAEISDDSCLREGCHTKRLLEGRVKFGRVWFDHAPHLTELHREKRLKCVSCHSQIVQGSHDSVTSSTCFLCHFKPGEELAKLSRCGICHGPPPETIRMDGSKFAHSTYVSRGVECVTCHAGVVRGSGEVSPIRCGNCHTREEHLERYKDGVFMHVKHVTEHKVDCLECHEKIVHPAPKHEKHVELQAGSCILCHIQPHNPLTAMYSGTGAQGVADRPNPMYLTNVTCGSCHLPLEKRLLESGFSSASLGTRISCMQCHGVQFGRMPAEWRETFDGTLAELQKLSAVVAEIEAKESPARPLPPELSARLGQARFNLRFLAADSSHGCHNPWYAEEIFRQVAQALTEAQTFFAPDLKPPEIRLPPHIRSKDGCTTACHQMIERREAGFPPLPFNHAKHLNRTELDCSACHSSTTHGKTTATGALCASCHHEKKAPGCAECHADVTRFISGGKFIKEIETKPDAMKDLGCTDCHIAPGKELDLAALKKTCIECHGDASLGELCEERRRDIEQRLSGARQSAGQIQRLLRERERAGHDVEKQYQELAQLRGLLSNLEQAGPLHNYNAADEVLAEVLRRQEALRKQLE